jgi:hypothetical protein
VTRALAAAALVALTATAALAQPPRPATESVTVTGTKDRKAIEGFVQSLAIPTRAAGKLARWQQGICPVVQGLKPAFVSFITRHLKDIAAQVGAPVNDSASCEHNIAVIFTSAPQTLADNIKKKQPFMLGYYDNQEQRDKLAAVTHPIQAWYRTATEDLRGQMTMDTGRTAGQGMVLTVPCADMYPGMGVGGQCNIQFTEAHAAATLGTRLADGMRAGLYSVVIVADPAKLGDYEIGALADYIAMLALAQITLPDGCQQLPSVLNMLAANYAQKTSTLTDNDIAFLKGLYKMGPDRTARCKRAKSPIRCSNRWKANRRPRRKNFTRHARKAVCPHAHLMPA